MRGIRRLEEKYGIKVVDDSFYNPLTKKWYKLYKMYSAKKLKIVLDNSF